MDNELEWETARRMIKVLEGEISTLKKSYKWWQRLYSMEYLVGVSTYEKHLLKYKLIFIKTAPIELINEIK